MRVSERILNLLLRGSNSGRRSQSDLDIGNGHTAFADCSGTTFHRTGAHVARSKNSWQTCFKRAGLMFTRLPSRCGDHADSGFDESFVVALDFRRQPVRAWSCADHGKHSRRSNVSAFAILGIFQLDFFKFFPARHFAYLSLVKDLNVLARFHSTREVLRHFVSDVFPANDE